MGALQVTSKQLAGEPSRRSSVASSYHRARASWTKGSSGSVFARVRQASSNGPPVQRTGTQASGTATAETRTAHDRKQGATKPESQALARSHERIRWEPYLEATPRS